MVSCPAWRLPLLTLGLGLPLVVAAGPAPPPAGATACTSCHAPAARAGGPIPTLEGRQAAELEAALLAFRNGERAPTVMDRIARGFTPEEIRAIAAWFGRS